MSEISDNMAMLGKMGVLYIEQCFGDKIAVVCPKDQLAARHLIDQGYEYRQLSPSQKGDRLVLAVKDDTEKAGQLQWLRDCGIPFSAGKEWNPQEVFEWLREKGLVTGGYSAISWSGPSTLAVHWEP